MSSPDNSPAPRRWPSLLVIGISLVGILLLIIGGAVWKGYQAGLTEREQEWQATQAIELNKQYNLGLVDLAAGRYELAGERFEYILKIDPNYPGAADKLTEAKVAQQITPTITPLPSLTPLAPVTPAADPASIFALAQQSQAATNWDEAIQRLTQLRALDPTYKASQVDQMLFTALRNRGVARIQAKDLEGGIFDLNQAEALGKLDQDAKNHRLWARYYLDALSYWGLNWQKTVELLSELHSFAPYFQDTPAKLHEAQLNYAAQLTAAGDHCGAAEQYAAAQALSAVPAIADKLATAQVECIPTPADGSTATPTAIP
jgi:tetratricopeptide (TPR) repeat protein